MVDYHWFLAGSGCDGRNVPVSRLLVKRRVAGLQFACVTVQFDWNLIKNNSCLFHLEDKNSRHPPISLGYLVKARLDFSEGNGAFGRLSFACPLYFLTKAFGQSVVSGMTLTAFMRSFFDKNNLSSIVIHYGGYANTIHVEQFIQAENENDYDFFCRLLDFYGLSYLLSMNDRVELVIYPWASPRPGKKVVMRDDFAPGLVGDARSNHGFFYTKVCRQAVDSVCLLDHEEFISNNLVHKKTQNEESCWQSSYYGFGRKNEKEAENFIGSVKARNNIFNSYEVIKGYFLSVAPLDVMCHKNKMTIVYSVSHSYSILSKKIQQKLVLLKVEAKIPIHVNYQKENSYLQKQVKSITKYNNSCLSDEGSYYVNWQDDTNPISVQRALYFVGLNQKNPPSSWHPPFFNKQKVMVGFINGRLTSPVIISGWTNSSKIAASSLSNKVTHVINAEKTGKLSFNDGVRQSGIKLLSKNLGLSVSLRGGVEDGISLLSDLGDAKVDAKKIQYQSKKSLISQSNQSSGFLADNFFMESQGDIFVQAEGGLSFLSNKKIILNSEKSLNVNSHADIKSTAENTIIESEQCLVRASQLDFVANNQLIITSNSSLVFSAGGSAIEMHASGIVNCYGALLTSGLANFSGAKLKHYYPGVPFVHPFFLRRWASIFIDKVDPVSSFAIADLAWSKNSALCGDMVDCQFFVKTIEKNQSARVIVSLYGKGKTEEIAVISNVTLNKVGLVRVPWKVVVPASCVGNDNDADDCYLKFSIYLNGKIINRRSDDLFLLVNFQCNVSYFVNKKQLSFPDKIVSVIDLEKSDSLQSSAQDNVVQVYSKQSFYNRIPWGNNTVYIALLENKKRLEMVDKNDMQPNFQQINCLLKQNPNKKIQQVVDLMPPFILCNMREDAEDGYFFTRSTLTREELDYCRQCNNSAIVFVHGFNVDYGFFGKHFSSVDLIDLSTFDLTEESEKSSKLSAQLSSHESHSYRDIKWLVKRFPVLSEARSCNLDKWLDQQWYLNGKGAHNWFINMEYNLNHANGFIENNYQQYRRIIHIAWSGDVSSAVNYPHAAKHAKIASKKLAVLMRQLKNEGFKTSIIAHSLGCAVVLMALQNLAENGFEKPMDCVALWEAAVPSDVFFPTKHSQVVSPIYLWHLPQAVTMAKKFVVLTCKNDNILGPIPQEKPGGLSYEQWLAHKPFLQEWLPAVMVQKLGLKSIYAAATWMGVSVTDLLDTDQQQDIYQQWVKLHPLDKQKKELPKQFYDFLQADMQVNHHDHKKLMHQLLINRDLLQCFVSRYGKDNFDLAPSFFIRWLALGLEKTESLLFDFEKVSESFHGALALADLMFYHVGYEPLLALGYEGPLMNAHIKTMLKNKKLILINQDDCLFSHSGMKVPSEDLQRKIYSRLIQELPGFADR